MKLLKITPSLEGAPGLKEAEKEEPPVFTKVSIRVKPGDAKLIINEEETGRTKYGGLHPPGTLLYIRTEREGYEPVIKEVEVSDTKAQEINIKLKEKPEPEEKPQPEKQDVEIKEPLIPQPEKQDVEIKEPRKSEPRPITWKTKAGSSPLKRGIVISGGMLFAADEKGFVYCYEASGEKRWSVSTQNRPNENSMPVGTAPVIKQDRTVFAGRKGTVVLLDLKAKEIIWQKKIGEGRIPGIFQDVPMGKYGVYPYAGKTFYALSMENGNELFRPVSSTCAPLYHKEILYYGTPDSMFTAMDAISGRILKSYSLDSNITLRPAVFEDNIIAATKSGTIYSLNPEEM